ncbi:MAG: FKBP-type peptidyl-prolyl cis-trans isomerase [Gemmataceae bacterium]|nr:FKBP-type peptidyl-prolyl cis-trans isomerase [Gemmataceae bacterium]
MRTVEPGDCVQVHYTKRFADGAVRSSRAGGGGPLDVTVGTDHPRLPGLGDALVGLAEGGTATVAVPAGRAHGPADPGRVRRVARTRFGGGQELVPGRRARMRVDPDRVRVVRVVEVRGRGVVVDLNHPRCGQAVVLEVELVAILAGPAAAGHWGP